MAVRMLPSAELEKDKIKNQQTSMKQSRFWESAKSICEFCTLTLFWWTCVETGSLSEGGIPPKTGEKQNACGAD